HLSRCGPRRGGEGVRAGLEALAEKYRVLLELRSHREALEAAGRLRFSPEEAARRRVAFRRLARRFPSSLSELELPQAELARRQAIVRRCLAGEGSPPEAAWTQAMVDLHLALRLLLSARRWMGRSGGGEAAFTRYCRRFEARARRRGLAGRTAAAWAELLGLAP